MTNNVWCNTKKQIVYCAICGEAIPMPYGSSEFLISVIKAFAKEHKNCTGKREEGQRNRAWFAGHNNMKYKEEQDE